MKHTLAIALAVVAVVAGIGATVAWASTRDWSGHMGNGHMQNGYMQNGHLQQMGPGHMGNVDPAAMRAWMAKVHPDLDPATLDKLAGQCSQAMKDGIGSMHGSGGMMGGSGYGGMMGGSGYGGMMGGSGSAGMMGGA